MRPSAVRKRYQPTTPRPATFRLGLEALEDRCVPTLLMALDDAPAQHLLAFDSGSPGTTTREVTVSGLVAGDRLDALHFRPATGGLYALGHGTSGTVMLRLYTLDPNTGAATLVSPAAGFYTAGVVFHSFDFDPSTDQIRLLVDGANLRVSPVTGTVTGTDTAISSNVEAIAYGQGAGGPTLYGIQLVNTATAFDYNLILIGSTQVSTVASLGRNLSFVSGLDIPAGGGDGTNTALAVLNLMEGTPGSGFTSELVSINLATGAVTTIGDINDPLRIYGLTEVPPGTFTPPSDSGGSDTPAAAPPVPLTPSQQFVSQVFQSLLGRNPDQNSLTTLASFLDQGAISQYQFVAAVEQSPEYLGRVVNQMFQAILVRPADPAGQQAGTLFLAAGGTQDELKALLYGSPEFYQKVGGADPAFLVALFGDVTGQVIDPAALNTLDGLLNAGTPRAEIARMVLLAAGSVRG